MNELNYFDYKYARGQFWRVGGGLAAFIGGSLILQLVCVLFMSVFPDVFEKEWINLLVSFFCTYGGGITSAVLIIRSGKKCKFRATAKMNPLSFLVAFCVIYAIAIAGNLISTVLMTLAGAILQKEIINPVSMDYEGVSLWIEYFGVLVLAPVLEELLFRKSIIDAVLPYGEGTAILLSSISFGLAHGNFFQFFYAAGIGALLAYIYIRTGKIRNTIILHFMMNFVGGVIPTVILDLAGGDILTPVVLAFELVLFGIAIAGLVLFIVNCRKFRIGRPTLPIPKGKRFTTVYLNPGMIIFVLLVTFLFVTSVLL